MLLLNPGGFLSVEGRIPQATDTDDVSTLVKEFSMNQNNSPVMNKLPWCILFWTGQVLGKNCRPITGRQPTVEACCEAFPMLHDAHNASGTRNTSLQLKCTIVIDHYPVNHSWLLITLSHHLQVSVCLFPSVPERRETLSSSLLLPQSAWQSLLPHTLHRSCNSITVIQQLCNKTSRQVFKYPHNMPARWNNWTHLHYLKYATWSWLSAAEVLTQSSRAWNRGQSVNFKYRFKNRKSDR